MALTISNLVLTQPTALVATGTATFDLSGVSGAATMQLYQVPGPQVGADLFPVAPCTSAYTGLAPGRWRVAVGYPTTSPTDFASIDFDIETFVPLPVVDSQPAAVTAAHLPMLASLFSDPVPVAGILTPAVLLAVVEVFRGAWVEVGKIREVCDLSGTARFDVSEFVKTQFTATPPDESGGADTALGIRWRVRFGRLPAFVGEPSTEAGTYGGLAVNAAEVVNPGLLPYPLNLGPASPYASVPTGGARFRTSVNAAADAVINTNTVPVNNTDWPCPVRQFVWLHPSGAWVWGFFSGRHDHGDETGDGTVVRRAGGIERYVSRGDVRERLSVYSDKVDFATYEVLRSVRTAIQVYERLPSGQYVPVIVEPGSYPGYRETAKVFEVNFTVRYPVQVRQTQ